LGYDNLTNINNSIARGLDQAELFLATNLRTIFGRVSQTDVFFVRSSFIAGATHRSSFLLSQGFVQASPAYTAKAALSRLGLAESDAIDLRAHDGDDLTDMDAEIGILNVDGIDLSGYFLEVTYDAGFATDAAISEMYDLSEVPDWLEEAARVSAMLTLAEDRTLRGDEESAIKTDHLKAALGSVVDSHVRYRPTAHRPL
jgi:hypothetical protein